ncbi:MAG TPA: class I SAM-dependent methyltransferase [Actinomycetes bacterium]
MFTDRTALQTAAYAEQGPLAARLAIYRWQRNPVDLQGLALAALAGVSGTVLDAGCGLGTYVARLRRERPDLRVLPLDLSAGMRPAVVGDIQALPLADASVGGALAMHMLYHVPDIPVAVHELRRVVQPGGVLVVSTNGVDDKLEVGNLIAAAVRDLTGSVIEPPDSDGRFTPEDAGVLRAEFGTVEVAVYDREVVVSAAEPVVAFVDSMRALTGAVLPAEVPWDAFLDAVRLRVSAEVERHGAWTMRSQVGILTCR